METPRLNETEIARKHQRRKHIERVHGAEHWQECLRCLWDYQNCVRKIHYLSAEEAHQAAILFNREHGYDRPLVPYFCEWCSHRHLTKKLNTYRRNKVKKQWRTWRIELELERRAATACQPPVPRHPSPESSLP